jgi:hypothetical protein
MFKPQLASEQSRMSTSQEWLLIGGGQHGKTIWVEGEGPIRFFYVR